VAAWRVDVSSDGGPAELWATASTAERGQVFARPVDDLWSSSASRDWCGASPRPRPIQRSAAEGARLDELDAGGAATASRRISAPVVRPSCFRRTASSMHIYDIYAHDATR